MCREQVVLLVAFMDFIIIFQLQQTLLTQLRIFITIHLPTFQMWLQVLVRSMVFNTEVIIIPMFILIFDINLCFINNNFSFLLIPLIFLLVLVFSISSYSFPIIAKYKIRLVDLLKLSVYLSFKNISLKQFTTALDLQQKKNKKINIRNLAKFFQKQSAKLEEK